MHGELMQETDREVYKQKPSHVQAHNCECDMISNERYRPHKGSNSQNNHNNFKFFNKLSSYSQLLFLLNIFECQWAK